MHPENAVASTVVTPSGIVKAVNAVPANAWASMVLREGSSPKTISSREEQPLKIPSGIMATSSAMVTLPRDLQDSKTPSPMLRHPGTVTSVSPEAANAWSPTVVTESGMETAASDVHP